MARSSSGRVHDETGLELRVILGSEEARLVHLAVREHVPLGRKQWVLVDVGGGSVEVSLVDDHGVLWSESHTMGSVRLLEELAGVSDEPGRFRNVLEEYVSTLRIPSAARYRADGAMIATGGNIEAIAKLIGDRPDYRAPSVVGVPALGALIERFSAMSFQQRIREFGLREDRADVIVPGAVVYERLAALVRDQYESMVEECGFVCIDATLPIHEQQEQVRGAISARIDLASFHVRGAR